MCCAVQVGSNDDNSSGGGYAYRASKAALNISALLTCQRGIHATSLVSCPVTCDSFSASTPPRQCS